MLSAANVTRLRGCTKHCRDVKETAVIRIAGKKTMETLGVFHLPRDSGNSGWVVNGTCFFGSFHWKISGKNGTSEKEVSFFPLETFRWNCVFHLRISQGLTSSRPFATISLERKTPIDNVAVQC